MSIIDHPQAAAREIPQIIGHYITDNTQLNKIYQAAKAVTIHPNKFTLNNLHRAVREAESCGSL